MQLLDYDAKRIHIFEQLLHATEGWLSATCENMTLHVNMTTKKVAPFQESVLRLLAGMKDAPRILAAAARAGPEGIDAAAR